MFLHHVCQMLGVVSSRYLMGEEQKFLGHKIQGTLGGNIRQ